QGVAIGILTRSAGEGVTPHVEYAELWGSRDEKLARLASGGRQPPEPVELRPNAPDWRFVPSRATACPEYDAGWLLTELMPVSTPAPVTARDHFVVAFTAD